MEYETRRLRKNNTPMCLCVFAANMDQAFKKARRQHIKTTKNRNCDVDATWTPFRAAEKKYKARFPPPDLSTVLDLAIDSGACRTRATRIGTSSEGTGVFTVDAVPGANYDIGTTRLLTRYRSRTFTFFHMPPITTYSRAMGTSRSCTSSKRDQPRRALLSATRRSLECPPFFPFDRRTSTPHHTQSTGVRYRNYVSFSSLGPTRTDRQRCRERHQLRHPPSLAETTTRSIANCARIYALGARPEAALGKHRMVVPLGNEAV